MPCRQIQNHLDITIACIFIILSFMPWVVKALQTRNIKNQKLKTTKRDHKKANKQDVRQYSIDSKVQDNIQLPL